MDELMKELKAITDAEGNKISDEWSKLQLDLLRQSIPLANEIMSRQYCVLVNRLLTSNSMPMTISNR